MSTSVLPDGITVYVYARTDVGMKRQGNEDSFLIADLSSGRLGLGPEVTAHQLGNQGSLMIVSDGLGGAAAGEVASAMAVQTVCTELMKTIKSVLSPSDRLKRATEQANEQIWSCAQSDNSLRGMGATLTAAFIYGTSVYIAQVGDSRAYIIRGGRVKQVTEDQSWANAVKKAGLELADVPSNVILQALGTQPKVHVEVTSVDLINEDVLLLCSDGLSNKIKDPEMREIASSTEDLAENSQKLIDLANKRGGEDNITVVLARFEGKNLASGLEKDLSITSTFKIVTPLDFGESLDENDTMSFRTNEKEQVDPMTVTQSALFDGIPTVSSAIPTVLQPPPPPPPKISAPTTKANEPVTLNTAPLSSESLKKDKEEKISKTSPLLPSNNKDLSNKKNLTSTEKAAFRQADTKTDLPAIVPVFDLSKEPTVEPKVEPEPDIKIEFVPTPLEQPRISSSPILNKPSEKKENEFNGLPIPKKALDEKAIKSDVVALPAKPSNTPPIVPANNISKSSGISVKPSKADDISNISAVLPVLTEKPSKAVEGVVSLPAKPQQPASTTPVGASEAIKPLVPAAPIVPEAPKMPLGPAVPITKASTPVPTAPITVTPLPPPPAATTKPTAPIAPPPLSSSTSAPILPAKPVVPAPLAGILPASPPSPATKPVVPTAPPSIGASPILPPLLGNKPTAPIAPPPLPGVPPLLPISPIGTSPNIGEKAESPKAPLLSDLSVPTVPPPLTGNLFSPPPKPTGENAPKTVPPPATLPTALPNLFGTNTTSPLDPAAIPIAIKDISKTPPSLFSAPPPPKTTLPNAPKVDGFLESSLFSADPPIASPSLGQKPALDVNLGNSLFSPPTPKGNLDKEEALLGTSSAGLIFPEAFKEKTSPPPPKKLDDEPDPVMLETLSVKGPGEEPKPAPTSSLFSPPSVGVTSSAIFPPLGTEVGANKPNNAPLFAPPPPVGKPLSSPILPPPPPVGKLDNAQANDPKATKTGVEVLASLFSAPAPGKSAPASSINPNLTPPPMPPLGGQGSIPPPIKADSSTKDPIKPAPPALVLPPSPKKADIPPVASIKPAIPPLAPPPKPAGITLPPPPLAAPPMPVSEDKGASLKKDPLPSIGVAPLPTKEEEGKKAPLFSPPPIAPNKPANLPPPPTPAPKADLPPTSSALPPAPVAKSTLPPPSVGSKQASFEEESPSTSAKEAFSDVTTSSRPKKGSTLNPKLMITLGGVVVLIIVAVVAIVSFSGKPDTTNVTKVTPTPEVSPTPVETPETPTPSPSPVATKSIKPSPVPTSTPIANIPEPRVPTDTPGLVRFALEEVTILSNRVQKEMTDSDPTKAARLRSLSAYKEELSKYIAKKTFDENARNFAESALSQVKPLKGQLDALPKTNVPKGKKNK